MQDFQWEDKWLRFQLEQLVYYSFLFFLANNFFSDVFWKRTILFEYWLNSRMTMVRVYTNPYATTTVVKYVLL